MTSMQSVFAFNLKKVGAKHAVGMESAGRNVDLVLGGVRAQEIDSY